MGKVVGEGIPETVATDGPISEEKSSRHFFGWTKLESIIALVSVIIAAAGVVISAVTAAFTYQQLIMLNNERMTPYRSIFFSTRLESYEGFVATVRRAERSMNDAIPSNFQGIDSRGSYDLPRTKVETVAAVKEMVPALAALRAQVDGMEVLWPNDTMLYAEEAAEEALWGKPVNANSSG
ncbi:MAG: hypothetical protein C0474_08820 [Sphingobium sp.]|nr:hypothetical protein [Sphingobium sp.]